MHIILIQEIQFYKFIRTDSLSKHSCFRDIAEIQAVQVLLQEIQVLQVHQFQWQFIHYSTLLRAPIGKNSTSTSKNIQFSHTPFVCTHMDQGLNAEPGTFSKNKDSTWQIQQATRKQVLLCI